MHRRRGSKDDSNPPPPADGADGEGDGTGSPSPIKKQNSKRRLAQKGRPSFNVTHTMVVPSLLSSSSKGTNFRGFFNLTVMVLVVTNLRLVIENFARYGLLVRIFPSDIRDVIHNWPLLWCFIKLHGAFLLSFVVEKFVFSLLPHLLTPLIALVPIVFMFHVPNLTIMAYNCDPGTSALLLCFSVTWTFKLISFHHTCFDYRRLQAEGLPDDQLERIEKHERGRIERFPQSLTLSHMIRFLWVPTICFQLGYPKLPRIRKSEVLKHTLVLALVGGLMKVLIEQYILVTVQNTFDKLGTPLSALSLGGSELTTFQEKFKWAAHVVERILKLSIPFLYLWLLLFVGLFHSWLNLLAELTQFGDRLFYLDWWNAAGFRDYWQKWNLPIHHFFVRHLYKPLLSLGLNKIVAQLVIFFVSAALHEYMVCVPLKVGFNLWVFTAFMFQAPLVALANVPILKNNPTVGNISFWTSFCFFGQPVAILLYYWIWTQKNAGVRIPTVPEAVAPLSQQLG